MRYNVCISIDNMRFTELAFFLSFFVPGLWFSVRVADFGKTPEIMNNTDVLPLTMLCFQLLLV